MNNYGAFANKLSTVSIGTGLNQKSLHKKCWLKTPSVFHNKLGLTFIIVSSINYCHWAVWFLLLVSYIIFLSTRKNATLYRGTVAIL